MRFTFRCGSKKFVLLLILVWTLNAEAQNSRANGGDFSQNTQSAAKVPSGVILVKGAWSSSSDSTTPVPEGGGVSGNLYRNQYFGMTYVLPQGWTEKYEGPPPSDSGRYVLAQIGPADSKAEKRGNILITAQDMFFTSSPAKNVMELAAYEKDNLQDEYRLELPITETKMAGQAFAFFAYWSPVAELHWYVLATEIRCHAVQFTITSHDSKLLESLVLEMNKMRLPAEGNVSGNREAGMVPVCISGYATSKNLITRVDPILTEHRFNPVPVRIIINRSGKVKYIHFLSAFPDQAKAISDALKQWQFRAYMQDGRPAEVETGVMFGRATVLAPHVTNSAVD